MPPPTKPPAPFSLHCLVSLWPLAALSAATGLIFISHQSFWMDEGGPAFKALMPSIRDWWFMTMRLGGSDAQMPVYMFLLWLWAKFAGSGEFLMRCINLPWLILAAISLRRLQYWPLVCLTSPFVLYYCGELRPYAMQIAAGSIAAAAMIRVHSGRDKKGFEGLHATAGASLLLAASSLTGAVWALGFWIGVLVFVPAWLGQRGFWIRISPWIGGAILLAGYYIFTLVKGFRAAGMEGSSVLSVFFGFYEMAGLLGFGPGKNELRRSVTSVAHFLPFLIPAFVSVFGAWLSGTCAWLKSSNTRTIAGVACAVLLPVLILSVTGLAMNFRVLGRHFSPAIPAVLIPIAIALSGQGSLRLAGRALGVAAVFCFLGSAVSLRISERHARDDFRNATTACLDELKQGKNVWWQADMNCLRYYAFLKGGMPLVNAVQILESAPPSSLFVADCVIINRPDLRYRDIDYQKELSRNSFRLDSTLTGFEIWKSAYH